jgi:hypothetical protein
VKIIIPLLGPSPQEFNDPSRDVDFKPTTFLSDDHTPIEFIWVLRRTGTMSVRFALDQVSEIDGSPVAPGDTISTLSLMGKYMSDFDLSWTQACYDTLVYACPSSAAVETKHTSQIFIGKVRHLPR